MLFFQMYTSVQFHIASKCKKLPSYQMRQKPILAKYLDLITKSSNTWYNIVILNLFSIENVYLFPEVIVGVVKWIFCYKEGVLMETDPFPANICRILNILL